MASMAEEGAVIACHDVNTWIRHFQTGKDSKKLVVVDFTASWCGPCRAIAPIFADLAKKFTEVLFLKVDVDELKTVSEEFKIEAMPTFIFFKEGSVVDTIVGARKDDLPRKLMTHM